MSSVLSPQDYYTAQFYVWEYRGRGLQYYVNPVDIEPEFIPFFGHDLPQTTRVDDGIRARFFPEIVHEFKKAIGVGGNVSNSLQESEALAYLEEQYPLNAYEDSNTGSFSELQLTFPNDTRIGFEYIEELLLLLTQGTEHISFEIVGTSEHINIQFACSEQYVMRVQSYVSEYLPNVVVSKRADSIIERFSDTSKACTITELGLTEEFTRPLRMYSRFEPDPYAGLFAVLGNLQIGECAVFQVLFKGVYNPWGQSMLWSVTGGSGKSFFQEDDSMLELAKEKVSKPLCVACPRIVVYSDNYERTNELTHALLHSIKPIERNGSNRFEPIQRDGITREDVLCRQSKRTGMILNVGELASMVHIPDHSVKSQKLRFGQGKTKELPQSVLNQDFVLGTNEHLGNVAQATLSIQQRLRHMHVIGATGTGKSNFLLGSIIQDMQLGNGLCVLDPHGDLIDKAILHLPDERLKDVIILDPSDEDFPIGLNLLDAQTEAEKIILSSDLVSLFRRFATSWGDQMTSVLANAINAFLNREEGGTLIELKRFLTEKKFREHILLEVSDPSITYYWKHEFPLLRSNSIASILTRLDTFLRSPLVRNMMAKRRGLDFHDIINSKKILLVKLSQGLIGEENSYLLGSIIIAKLHQSALHRQSMKEEERTPFFMYVDEFQHFITPSMSAILSGARKYGLGLVLAHQDMEQVRHADRELANSVLANPATRVAFRCGEQDAKELARGLAYFDDTDLQNLSIGNAIARVERKDNDFNISVGLVKSDLDTLAKEAKTNSVIEWSRSEYGGSKEEIEAELFRQYGEVPETIKVTSKKKNVLVEPIEKEAQIKVDSIDEKAKEFVQKETEKQELREHRHLQDLIKRTGENFGFLSTIEEPTPDGTGRIDVALKRDDMSIAVEVAVTNTVAYEVQNIRKCLDAGYDSVVVCSDRQKHLEAIEIESKKGKQKKVVFHSSNSFLEFIQGLVVPQESENVVKGYRVKVNIAESAISETKSTDGVIAKLISQTILSKPSG